MSVSSSSSLPQPPARRELKSPYFLLRTPDGLGSYFTGENMPIVSSPKEPLSRFLAPARLMDGSGPRAVVYELPASILETARPLDVLPQSEIDRFQAAAAAFYQKAHASAPRIVPHEKRLRAHFLLPDPQVEPDAYWVYGPVHDRKLLILWGVEVKSGTSLPLAPSPELGIAAGATILDRLQARAMGWEARQREALRFAFEAGEPISRFLARPAVDAKGAPVGWSCHGRTIPSAKAKALRRIATSECAAFERAAKTYYDRASGATPYEREIRQALRLPDPDASDGAYRIAGKRLLILVNGRETRAQTLPLVEHPLVAADAPAPAAAAAPADPLFSPSVAVVAPASPTAGPTVAARLRRRSISTALVASLKAAAVLALAAMALLGWRWAVDRTPPRVVESSDLPAALDNHTVVVAFTKAIGSKSLQLGPGDKASFGFGDDDASILAERVDGRDSKRVVLTTTPLVDGRTYQLMVDHVSDRSGNRLAEPTSVSFRYLDTVAPRIALISAGENANQLAIVFSKPVSEASLARGGNYAIFALQGSGEGEAQRIASAHLDPEDKSGRTAILEAARDFVGNAPYRLESLGGVTDNSVSRNPAFLPAKGMDFAYRDLLPPKIRSISASARKLALTVTFSKPVDATAGAALANYSAVGPDHAALTFLPNTASFDPTGRSVTFRLAATPLSLGTYHLTVHSMRDRLGNRISAPLVVSFEFADDDGQPLNIASHSLVAADNQLDNRITLTFNRALNPDEATRASSYELLGDDGTPLDPTVVEARRVPEDPAKILLILSEPPTPGVKVLVRVTGVSDIFGRKPADPIEYAFVPPGIPEPTEQVLAWMKPPRLEGDSLTLSIREAVARRSALSAANYVLSGSGARVRGVTEYEVHTDPVSGSRSTEIVLAVEVPASARRGLTVRARSLRADGLDFLGPQRLAAALVAER